MISLVTKVVFILWFVNAYEKSKQGKYIHKINAESNILHIFCNTVWVLGYISHYMPVSEGNSERDSWTAGYKDRVILDFSPEREMRLFPVFLFHTMPPIKLPPAHILLWPECLCSYSYSLCLSHKKGSQNVCCETLLMNVTLNPQTFQWVFIILIHSADPGLFDAYCKPQRRFIAFHSTRVLSQAVQFNSVWCTRQS